MDDGASTGVKGHECGIKYCQLILVWWFQRTSTVESVHCGDLMEGCNNNNDFSRQSNSSGSLAEALKIWDAPASDTGSCPSGDAPGGLDLPWIEREG